MNVSVIIPVLNEHDALIKLLPWLMAQNSNDQLELIVCDGGSSDLTCPYVNALQNKCSFVYLVQSDLGRAKQMNAGAQRAKHERLLFLHADTQLPLNWFDLIADKSWGRFDVRLSGSHFMLRAIETMMNWRSCITQVATGDQAIYVQKNVFDKIGGFPNLPIMEDIALSKLLRLQHTMACIKTPLVTSSRRWEKNGVFKTIGLMWRLRLAYFCGVSPQTLAKQYYPHYGFKRLKSIVQVFTKLPILGYVKTRLIPHVGEQSATDIHRYLLKHTLKVVKDSKLESELWVAQEKQHSLLKNDEFLNYETIEQQGNDLGGRMGLALQKGLKSYVKVILIGTDCLDLSTQQIQNSIKKLDDVDVVLTPVEDGGFISIACRVFDAQLFDNVAWGTASALADVLVNIKRLSLSHHLLEPVRDIDTYDDVIKYPELTQLFKRAIN